MTAGDAERFWQFSLRFYGIPEVQEDCLHLQDEAGLNVNLILWCCWQAAQGRKLTEAQARAAAARIADWSNSVTQPLRALRRQVKAGLAGFAPEMRERLHERLKAAELEAERVEQTLLCGNETAGTETAGGAVRDLAKANMDAYMGVADTPLGGRLRKAQERLAGRLAIMGCA